MSRIVNDYLGISAYCIHETVMIVDRGDGKMHKAKISIRQVSE